MTADRVATLYASNNVAIDLTVETTHLDSKGGARGVAWTMSAERLPATLEGATVTVRAGGFLARLEPCGVAVLHHNGRRWPVIVARIGVDDGWLGRVECVSAGPPLDLAH